MPRRPANITQADVARVIRAVQAAGLPVHRVVVRADGVAVETVASPVAHADRPEREDFVDEGRVVVL